MKFNSSHLQSCFDTAKPILENIDKTKNSISEDIRSLEAYLKSTNINESIDYLATDPTATCNVNCEIFSEDAGGGSGTALEERLRWDNEKRRLIYIRNEYQASIDIYQDYSPVNIEWFSINKIIEKPLIEAPFEIRKFMYENNHLGNFLTSVSNKFAIKNDDKKCHESDEEIPF